MANEININETQFLLGAVEQSFPPQTLFLDTFFPNIVTFPTKTVMMDYRKGNRKMSPFVSRGASGVNVGRTGFSTKSYEPPMMAPERPTTVEDLDHRSFGENVFSQQTPEQRAMALRAQDLADLRSMNVRRAEWMGSQLMINGSFVVEGLSEDGTTKMIDTVTYDFTQKLTLTGADLWSNADSDMYGQMQDMHRTVRRNSGRNPGVAIASDATMSKMLKNNSMLKYLMVPSRENLAFMSIQPRVVAPGVVRFGYIQSLDLELWSYDGIYQDDNDDIQQYIPDGYFIMGVTGRGSQLFGAITQMEQDGVFRTYQGSNVPKVWNEVGKDVQKIRLASKCVPKPEFVDDWFTLKCL